MINFFLEKNNKFHKRSIILIFFISLLIIGSSIFHHYGISIDEAQTRSLGFMTLKYIYQIFDPSKIATIDNIISVPQLHDFHSKSHGAVIVTLFAYIESVFNIVETKMLYLIRHYLCFILFFIGVYFFYLIGKFRYDDWRMGLLGSVFLVLSPRIFAESFYNIKDIVFMSSFIISLYCCLKFINKPNIKHAVIFSLASALATDLRIMGALLPFLTMFFLTFISFREKKFIKNHLTSVLLFLILVPVFTVVFWPYLWPNPIVNFLEAFKSFSSFWFNIQNFYFGNYIMATDVPWHYSLVWIAITTPIIYGVFFIFGFYINSVRFIKRLLSIDKNKELNDLWRGKKEMVDLIILFSFFVPIFLVITLNSTLYDGWRHLYFIYPSFLLISIYGFDKIIKKIKRKNLQKYFIFTVMLFLMINLINMFKIHPYQNVYFNYLAGKNPEKNFVVDYWGLSNKQAMEFILLDKNEDVFKIYPASNTDLYLSSLIFSEDKKKKFKIVYEKSEADYIISNGIFWGGNPEADFAKIPSNFKLFKEIRTNRTKILSIFKKI